MLKFFCKLFGWHHEIRLAEYPNGTRYFCPYCREDKIVERKRATPAKG